MTALLFIRQTGDDSHVPRYMRNLPSREIKGMNNTIKIATDILTIAIIISGGLLIKPLASWLLTQLYKIFISSGYFK